MDNQKDKAAEIKLIELKLSLTEGILSNYEKIHGAINGVATNLVGMIKPDVGNYDVTMTSEKMNTIFVLANSLRQNGWQDLYNKGQYEDELKEIRIKRDILNKL